MDDAKSSKFTGKFGLTFGTLSSSVSPPIFFISGPPASGKSTLCEALVRQFDRGLVIPVDDLRLWVKSGLAESVPWTDESERQFQLAEEALCAMLGPYHRAGFAVVVDHCRNPERLSRLIADTLPDLEITKVLLLPDLETNLQRSHTRTNKSFDCHILDETIMFTNDHFRRDVPPDWLIVDNSHLTVEETMAIIHQNLATHRPY